MYGKGLVANGEVNHHKQMATGKADAGGMAGSIKGGVTNRKTTTALGELSDGARAAGPGVGSGSHGQQAAPDHGDIGRDHHRRGGKL